MAFAFERADRGPGAGLRRIALEQIDGALAETRAPMLDTASRIHALRKRTKKLRGLLRLVRPVLPPAREAGRALGAAARVLAPARDAEVRLATFEALAATRAQDAPAGLAARLRADLEAQAGGAALDEALEGYGALLAELRAEVAGWRPEGAGFAMLAPGLATTWEAARQGLARATRAAGLPGLPAEPFHDWRRVVKHHWYQARLLAPIWPEVMEPHVARMDDLGETLGAHNDIDVLMLHLRAPAPDDPAPDDPALAALERVALEERERLAARALAQGARILAGGSGDLVRRWGAWWALWHAGR